MSKPKHISLKDLQKALDTLQHKRLPFNDTMISCSDIDALCNLFSAFQAEYEGQVHVDRKQLEHMILKHKNNIKALKTNPTLCGEKLIAIDNAVITVLEQLLGSETAKK